MSQTLTSAEYYHEPSDDDDLAELNRTSHSNHRRLVAKAVLLVVFWSGILGGGAFLAFRAASVANKPKSYSGHGAGPALNMLSFFMNLLDFDWDRHVDSRIQNHHRSAGSDPYPVDEIPNDFADHPDIQLK